MDLAELKEEVRFDLMIIMRSLKSVRITQISPTIVGYRFYIITFFLLLQSYEQSFVYYLRDNALRLVHIDCHLLVC